MKVTVSHSHERSGIQVRYAYSEKCNVVEELIVEGKVVAWDDIDTSILLDLPVGKTETLSLREELLTREFAAPVCLSCFLEVTKDSHAGETENSRLDHDEGCSVGETGKG